MLFDSSPRQAVAKMALLIALSVSVAYGADEKEHRTTTPIKHVVVIFQENVSFDHYFATYPHAANPAGEPQFLFGCKDDRRPGGHRRIAGAGPPGH